jgi:hypothetical protein
MPAAAAAAGAAAAARRGLYGTAVVYGAGAGGCKAAPPCSMATPAAGFLRFKIHTVDAKASTIATARHVVKGSLRLVVALCFAYCGCVALLAIVAVAAHPLGTCVGFGETFSLELCECTCFVAEAEHPELPFYHPAAPTEEVVEGTVEPDLVRERAASLCGPCPFGTDRCVRAQAAQTAPRYDVYVGADASLRCYSVGCAAEVRRLLPGVPHGELVTADGACLLQVRADGACGPPEAVDPGCGPAAV